MASTYIDFANIPYERISKNRILTGYSNLDYAIKGIMSGITLLVGNTSSGKSLMTQSMIASALKQNHKVWVFAGEHSQQSLKELLYSQNSDKEHYVPITYKDQKGNDTNITDWYVTEEQQKKVDDIFAHRLFVYDNNASRKIDNILASMEECHTKEQVDFFVVDNLISIDNISSNVFAEQTNITEKIRQFAITRNVAVLLIAHQRKIAPQTFRLTLEDCAGSMNITNKAYNVIAIYRKDYIRDNYKDKPDFVSDLARDGFDFNTCDGFLEVIKDKANGRMCIGLNYDNITKTYRQADKISQTQADRIIKTRKQQSFIPSIDELQVVDEGDLPF